MRKALAVSCLGLAIVSGASYIAGHVYAEKWAIKNFVEFQKSTLYLDGLVFDKAEIAPGIVANRLYFQGNPLKLLFGDIDRVWVDDLSITHPEWMATAQLPDAPLEIDHITAKIPVMDEEFSMVGSLKSVAHHRYVFDAKSTDPRLKMKARGEVQAKKGKITSLDIEFENARLKDEMVQAWRAAGWVNIMQKEGWQITGQFDAGSARFGSLDLSDPVLRINGPLSKPEISFSGLNPGDGKLVAFETGDQKLTLEYGDSQSKIFDRKKFDQKVIADFTKKMAQKPKIVKKEKTVEIATEALPKKDPVITAPVIPLTYKVLSSLVIGTPLEGFVYSNPLVYLEQSCENAAAICWVARGQGGVFGYNADKVPSYMALLQDYEMSSQMKTLLQHVTITRLTLKGRGDKASFMNVNGKTPDGTPVHMELALDSAE